MGPKRARSFTPSSSDSSSQDEDVLDTSKFVNLSAQAHYFKLASKSFVQERGLKPTKADGQLLEMIKDHAWFAVVATPVAAPMAIVREFYANARETQNGISFVRGKEVSYLPSAIREVFHLPTLPAGKVNWVIAARSETDLNRVVRDLCVPGTQWATKPGTDIKTTFPHAALNRYAKAWNNFICANLMPSTHQHDVTIDRAVILWGIVVGKYIDVGYLMHQSMLRYMRGSTTGGIPHASLVTQLCAQAGVEWEDEQVQMPSQDITHATIKKYVEWDGGTAHPRGRGFIIPSPPPEAPPQPSETAEPPQASSAQQDRQMRHLQARMDALHGNFSAFADGLTRALGEAFAQQGTMVEWPVFGSAMPYPPPDSPPEPQSGGHADS